MIDLSGSEFVAKFHRRFFIIVAEKLKADDIIEDDRIEIMMQLCLLLLNH